MTNNFTKAALILLTISLFITACAPAMTAAAEPTMTPSLAPAPTSTTIPTVTYTPTPDISNLSIDEIVQAYMNGIIEYPTELSDFQEAEFSAALIEYINQNVGHSIHITKTFKGIDYDIYWSPTRGRWRSNHNTPTEELDRTGDSFPELIVSPDAIILEKIALPNLGEKTLIELYQMRDDDLKNYTAQLIKEAIKARTPDTAPAKLQQLEWDILSSNLLPLILDPGSKKNNVNVHIFDSAHGPTASIPEAGVDFIEEPSNVVLMPILNNQGEIICFVRLHQTSRLTSGVTEFFKDGTITTGGYQLIDSHVFGNTKGDSFSILTFGNTPDMTDSLLEGEEGIGDLNTIKKLKKAQTLKEVSEILQGIRIIIFENLQAVIER